MLALANRHYDVAAEEFTKSIEWDPSNTEAYSYIGYMYLTSDMMNKAFEYQGKALEVDPNYALAYYSLAQIYSQ